MVQIRVDEIESNPFQPRRDFDESAIAELSASLVQHGMIQPLIVRRHGDRLSTHRRRTAAAGGHQGRLADVPAQIREADDRQMSEVAIVENLQRKDLNPLEKAGSFQQYLERYGCTQDELARRLNIDRSTIANLIRLLELPEPIQQSLRAGAISQGHARALLPLGDEREQVALCQRIQAESLSVRATEEMVQRAIHSDDREPLSVVGVEAPLRKTSKRGGQHNAALEQQLRAALGTKVELKQKANGRGQIVIYFASAEEFERIREHLSVPSRRKAG